MSDYKHVSTKSTHPESNHTVHEAKVQAVAKGAHDGIAEQAAKMPSGC
jgi:hypothetical protein